MSTVKIRPRSRLKRSIERVDLLVGRAALEPALDREAEHRDRGGRGLGVDDAHLSSPSSAAAVVALSIRAGERRREVERVDALVAAELLVGREEVARRRLRRRRQLVGSAQPRVELARVRARRSRGSSRRRSGRRAARRASSGSARAPREVGRRVEDDRRVLGGQVHQARCSPDRVDDLVELLVLRRGTQPRRPRRARRPRGSSPTPSGRRRRRPEQPRARPRVACTPSSPGSR